MPHSYSHVVGFILNVALFTPAEKGEHGWMGDVGVCIFPNIGLATGNGLSSVCGLPSAGKLQFGSSSPRPPKSMCVGGFLGATLARGGSKDPVEDDRLGAARGGFIPRFTIRLGRLPFCTCGSIGGGSGEVTPGEIDMSAGRGDSSPPQVPSPIFPLLEGFESLLRLAICTSMPPPPPVDDAPFGETAIDVPPDGVVAHPEGDDACPGYKNCCVNAFGDRGMPSDAEGDGKRDVVKF